MNTRFILDILHAVEIGARWVVKRDPPESTWGNVKFTLDDGTILVVFGDEGVWDYVDSVILADGTTYQFWGDDMERWSDVHSYRPPKSVIEDIYEMEA